jgi:hypothetical protein
VDSARAARYAIDDPMMWLVRTALTMALIRTPGDEVHAHGAAFSVVFVPYKPHIVAGAPENHPFVPLPASALFARVFSDPAVRAETLDLYQRWPVLASPDR